MNLRFYNARILTMEEERAPKAPDSSMAAINSMAVEMMRDVSRYANVPSAKCLKGIPSPPTKAPATAPSIMEMDTGSLKRRLERRNTPNIERRHISSISKVSPP